MLYTFYPPLLASPWYYGGVFLLVGGSMIWVVLMIINMIAWKLDNSGEPVPLAMFAITATALLWAWSASGVVIELLGVILFKDEPPDRFVKLAAHQRKGRRTTVNFA